jgi:hypothetical protein
MSQQLASCCYSRLRNVVESFETYDKKILLQSICVFSPFYHKTCQNVCLPSCMESTDFVLL